MYVLHYKILDEVSWINVHKTSSNSYSNPPTFPIPHNGSMQMLDRLDTASMIKRNKQTANS